MKTLSKQLLSSLGLAEAQAAVYLAALELGESNMQELALKSGIKRTSIYNFIDQLKERGLLIEMKKKKRKIYSAVEPKQLIEIEKLHLNELERAMPELMAIQNTSRKKPRVTFYEGIENVLAVYEDQLKENKPIIAYEDLETTQGIMPASFFNSWPTERAKRNISFKSILRDSPAAREFVKKNIKLLRQSKIVSANPWQTEINIYGNKVAMMRFRENYAMCVLIEDEDIAQTLRFGWQKLWDSLNVPVIG